MDRLFLDPEGANLDEMEEALGNSVRLLKHWWIGENEHGQPRPAETEIRKLVEALDDSVKMKPFSKPYKSLGPCIKMLFGNLRFNKNNLVNVHPSPLLPALVASFVAMLQNPNNLSCAMSPATTAMEEECIAQLAELAWGVHKLEESKSGGHIVSCGTISNLSALMVARDKVYQKAARIKGRYRLSELGLYSAPRGLVVTSMASHVSIRRNAAVLGLGENSVVRLPVADADEIQAFEESGTPLKLRPSERSYSELFERLEKSQRRGYLRQVILSVVPTMGTTSAGTIEPIRPLLKLRKKYGFHLHVDAAIGGLALGLDEIKTKAVGIEQADSITLDPHKLGFVPYPCSAVLFRDKSDLELIGAGPQYPEPVAHTIEGSRPGFNLAALWVALRTLGVNGYSKLIGELISRTRWLASALKDNGYQVVHEVDLNTLCFSIPQKNESRRKLNQMVSRLHSRIVDNGRYLIGKVEDVAGVKVRNTPWRHDQERVGLSALKVWIMNPYTREQDLELFLVELNETRKRI